VTVAQWEAFRKDRDPSFEPSADPPSYPKVNVTWYEARAYAEWLSEKSRQGIIYRLPSEAEWEYAARGGPGGEGLLFGWGNEITPQHANYDAARSFRRSKTSSRSKAIAETEKYPAGKFELYGMHGNVAEWVADCYHPYTPHPSNGEAVEKGEILGIVRGGSYISPPEDLRCAARQEFRKSRRAAHVGFRVAHNGPAVEED
jgi:formylglycine-generating enzyme required for sulfatase activity